MSQTSPKTEVDRGLPITGCRRSGASKLFASEMAAATALCTRHSEPKAPRPWVRAEAEKATFGEEFFATAHNRGESAHGVSFALVSIPNTTMQEM